MFLTKNFEKLLHDRLGEHSREVLTPKRIREAVRNFEGTLKLTFDHFDQSCDETFEIPLPGAPDIPTLGLEEGYLKLSRCDC